MAEFPALPLWTDAYLADTSHLTPCEHGRYLLMLVHLWRAPGVRFPNDDEWLARKFGVSLEAFQLEWKPLFLEFLKCDGNWWTSTRLLLEWSYLKKQSYQRTVAAKARWAKEKSICGNDAGPHTSRNAPTPTPTPTPTPLSNIGIAKAIPPSGGRWADDRTVPDDWLGDAELARDQHQLPRIDLRLEAEQFQNYWASKSGQNATKRNWKRTWINWALKAHAPRGAPKPTAHDKFLSAAAALIRNELEQDGEGGDNSAAFPAGNLLLSP